MSTAGIHHLFTLKIEISSSELWSNCAVEGSVANLIYPLTVQMDPIPSNKILAFNSHAWGRWMGGVGLQPGWIFPTVSRKEVYC